MNRKASALKIIGTMLIVLIVIGIFSYLYLGLIIPLLQKFGFMEQSVEQSIGETSSQLVLEQFASDMKEVNENYCYKVYDYYELISLKIMDDLDGRIVVYDQNNENNKKIISEETYLKIYTLNDETLSLHDRSPGTGEPPIIELTRVGYTMELKLLPRLKTEPVRTQKIIIVKTSSGLGVVFEGIPFEPEKLFYEGKEIQNCKSIKDQSNNEENQQLVT